jgi:colanic acid/amylovoran biosynthesis protein
MMMAENFIYYFEKLSGQKNIYYVETEDIENTQRRLRHATGLDNIYAIEMDSFKKRKYKNFDNRKKTNKINSFFIKINYVISYVFLDWINSFLNKKKVFSNLVNDLDKIIILGGDDLTEDYGWINLVLQLLKINTLLNSGKQIYLVGQTMGPYYSFRKSLVKSLLKRVTKIYARDVITYNYLKDMGLKNIDRIPDLALLPLAKETNIHKDQKYIIFCPSELIYRYSKEGSRDKCIDFYINLCKYLLNKYKNLTMLILAHVLKPENVDDRKMVKEIYNVLKVEFEDRIRKIDEEIYPYQVRDYIKQSYFVVSARMHPIISSIECNVPSISISYSRKYWGILGDGYNLKDYIIDMRHYENYNQIFEEFEKKVSYLQQNREKFIKNIRLKNKKDQEVILLKIKDILQRKGEKRWSLVP